MNPLIQLKKVTPLVHVVFVLAGFASLLRAQAAPETALPNFNTADGQNALFSVTTGAANTAVGWFSLFSDTAGSFNTASGAGTLLFNNADSNTAFGTAALLFNTDGSDNTAVGTSALLNTTASGNTAVGSRALVNNTTGGTLGNIQGIDVGPNVAVGWEALESNTTASANTAVGYQALHSFTTGPMGFEQLGLCTAVGFQALANDTGAGISNNAFGFQALMNDTDGGANTAIGLQALFNNASGGGNVAIGNNALLHNDNGDNNTAIGLNALTSNIGGSENTAIGFDALGANMTGNDNTVVGAGAGVGVEGNNNTILGANAGGGIGAANNVIAIGSNGGALDNSCFIGNIFGTTSPGGIGVFVNSDGKLGTTVSSRRFKEDIKPMDKVSEGILALQPVTFRYKKEFDPTGASQFGLVAEDVEKVNPDLVVHDKDGKPYSVRYDQVNAMLLNEFLKEHRKVEEQAREMHQQQTAIAELKSTIAQQQKGMDALLAHIKEQDSKIQRVSDQVKVSKAAPKVVLNNP